MKTSHSDDDGTVDVSAIRIGDEVTVKVEVVDISDGLFYFDWVIGSKIISHTPQPRPSTLAEFDSSNCTYRGASDEFA